MFYLCPERPGGEVSPTAGIQWFLFCFVFLIVAKWQHAFNKSLRKSIFHLISSKDTTINKEVVLH